MEKSFYEQMVSIAMQAKNFAEEVRRFSRNQIDLWRMVPAWALEADGRRGFSDQLARAYQYRRWSVSSSNEGGLYRVEVDLSTGELLKAGSDLPALDDCVLKVAGSIQQLDAKSILNSLVVKANQPYDPIYDPKKQESWRAQYRKLLNLPNPRA